MQRFAVLHDDANSLLRRALNETAAAADGAAGGGSAALPRGCVTMLSGRSGAGKSALCRQLCAHAAAEGRALLVETVGGGGGAAAVAQAAAERYFASDAYELMALLDALQAEQRGAAEGARPVRLLVVDSVADLVAPLACDEMPGSSLGQGILSSLAWQLRAFAAESRASVVVVNAMTADMAGARSAGAAPLYGALWASSSHTDYRVTAAGSGGEPARAVLRHSVAGRVLGEMSLS